MTTILWRPEVNALTTPPSYGPPVHSQSCFRLLPPAEESVHLSIYASKSLTDYVQQ
jgi:hypothetical protein